MIGQRGKGKRSRSLWRCRRGAAAVEFALAFSFILMPVMLGSIEFYLYSSAARRVSAAADALSRITAYRSSVETADMQNTLFYASDELMGGQAYTARLSYLTRQLFIRGNNPDLNLYVFLPDWCAQRGTWTGNTLAEMIRNVGTDDRSSNTDLIDHAEYVIVSEVSASYTSPFSRYLTGAHTISRRSVHVSVQDTPTTSTSLDATCTTIS